MISKPNEFHMQKLNNIERIKNIEKIKTHLDNIFRNGIKDPSMIPYVSQLLRHYYELTNTDYKLNKENTIV